MNIHYYSIWWGSWYFYGEPLTIVKNISPCSLSVPLTMEHTTVVLVQSSSIGNLFSCFFGCFLVAAFIFASAPLIPYVFHSHSEEFEYWLRTSSLIRLFIVNLLMCLMFQPMTTLCFLIWAVLHLSSCGVGAKDMGFESEDLGLSPALLPVSAVWP